MPYQDTALPTELCSNKNFGWCTENRTQISRLKVCYFTIKLYTNIKHINWLLQQESNLSPTPYQDAALPTELCSNKFGCGNRTRTYECWIQNPVPYQLGDTTISFKTYKLVAIIGIEPSFYRL